MTASADFGWAPKALPWFCLLLVELGAARAFTASAERLPVPIYDTSLPVRPSTRACDEMDKRVDMNVLVALQTDQLLYLQASLCPANTTGSAEPEAILDGRTETDTPMMPAVGQTPLDP
jgi:hypothetical protein